MSLSNLLHYDSDDDGDVEPQRRGSTAAKTEHNTAASSSPPATAAPIAVHPLSHSAQPTAPLAQLEKRALSDDEQTDDDDRSSKRWKRRDAVPASFAQSFSASSPQSFVPPPASFFSFAAPASSTAPAAATDLLSILPPPKNTRARNTVARQRPMQAANAEHSGLSSAQPVQAPTPPARPATPPPPAAASTSRPAPPSPASTAPAEPPVAPPPGIRKKVTSAVQEPESTSAYAPLPNPFAASVFPGLFTAPHIAYSTASPYAVQSSQPSASAAQVTAPASYASYEEPRMQRQWMEAAHIVDVRVDDLTQPPSASSTAGPQLHSAAAVGDVRVKTAYWDARQGKEVAVWGVQGRQQRAHQINSLAIQAKKLESDIMRMKEQGAQNRRNTRSKYGW